MEERSSEVAAARESMHVLEIPPSQTWSATVTREVSRPGSLPNSGYDLVLSF